MTSARFPKCLSSSLVLLPEPSDAGDRSAFNYTPSHDLCCTALRSLRPPGQLGSLMIYSGTHSAKFRRCVSLRRTTVSSFPPACSCFHGAVGVGGGYLWVCSPHSGCCGLRSLGFLLVLLFRCSIISPSIMPRKRSSLEKFCR